jgi:tRNA(Arg) A34 adenosine deaminase TadA
VSRRRIVQGIGALMAGTSSALMGADRPIKRSDDDASFMQHAFEMRRRAIARGDQPYGAVVVRDGRIIGDGVSAVVTNSDPTAHAELEAIRDAVRKVGTEGVRGATLFGTARACAMCETGAYHAGIAAMFYGEWVTAGGTPRPR